MNTLSRFMCLLALVGLVACTSGGDLTDGLSRDDAEATATLQGRLQDAFPAGTTVQALREGLEDRGFVYWEDEALPVSRPLDAPDSARATVSGGLRCTQSAVVSWRAVDGIATDITGRTFTTTDCG